MPTAEQIINELFPNLWIFIAHTLATISLLIILSKLVYEPFKRAMRNRRQEIKSILIQANKKNDIADKKEKQNNKLLEETRSKVNQVIQNAQTEAEIDKEKILKIAMEQSEEMVNNAKKAIISENKKNNEHLREVISKNAVLIASKIVEKQLKESDHNKIIDNFISNLDLNEDYND